MGIPAHGCIPGGRDAGAGGEQLVNWLLANLVPRS